MALKIRCGQCRKKISIDEAFAGSVCRCPYCGALTLVPGEMEPATGGARSARPGQPARRQSPPWPTRPEAPPAPPVSQAPPPELHQVPLARPVLIQGIVAIVMAGLLAVMVVVLLVLYFMVIGKGISAAGGPGKDGPRWTTSAEQEANPFTLGGARIAGLPVESPVVYVLDASSGMRECFDAMRVIARRSILSLGSAGKFDVIVVREEGPKLLADALLPAGQPGDARAKAFLGEHLPGGATELRPAVEKALTLSAKSVVVLADKNLEDAVGLGDRARQMGSRLYAVRLASTPEAVKPMADLCRQTGGELRLLPDMGDVEKWLDEAPRLE